MSTERVAVCLSGLPRDVSSCWRSLNDNLLAYLPSYDVFIHSGEEYLLGPEFFTTIAPKRYVIEPQFRHDALEELIASLGYYVPWHIPNCVQQMFGLKRVWELKKQYEAETGTKYTWAIRVRPDLLFLKPIKLEMLEPGKINTLHHPDNFLATSEFAIGPDAAMDKYFGIYDWMLAHGEEVLTKQHPRLICTPDNLYHNDIFYTAYLLDYLGLKIGMPTFGPILASHTKPSPYDYYRIILRHKKNEYRYDPGLFYGRE